jgi:hypothetical protein
VRSYPPQKFMAHLSATAGHWYLIDAAANAQRICVAEGTGMLILWFGHLAADQAYVEGGSGACPDGLHLHSFT